jgi:flagellar hook-associated protein 1 FlgK
VGASLDQLYAATGDLANRPADLSTRQGFLAATSQFAARVSSVGDQLTDMALRTDRELQQTVGQVNDRLTQIRNLNDQIARIQVGGQPPNDLLDQRDAAIASLGQLMAVSTVTASDGSLNVYSPSGAPLVVGSHVATLSAVPDPADPSRIALRLDQGNNSSQYMDAAALGGGSLAGLLQFRDQDLAAARSQLGALAQRVADAFNTRHALGVDASGAPGAALFTVVTDTTGLVTGLKAAALSPSQLATGMAALPQAAATNTGGARVSGFEIARTTTDSALAVTITFNNPPTTVNVSGLAGGATLANVPYVPGQPLPAAPADWNGWRITLDGGAAAGDSFSVGATGAPRADNRNALALGQLANGRAADGSTMNEAYASLIADVGNRVQGARQLASVSSAMKSEAVSRHQATAGVNLDEEAADMLRYQQAYQASAKIIQASQTLFETLLSATGR